MIYLLSIKNFKALVPLQLGVTNKQTVIEYFLYNNGTDSSLIQEYVEVSVIEIQDIMGRIYRACSRSGTLLIIFKGSEQLQISVKARQQMERAARS